MSAIFARQQLRLDVTERLVSAFVLSRLDYCNAVLACLLRDVQRQAGADPTNQARTNKTQPDFLLKVHLFLYLWGDC